MEELTPSFEVSCAPKISHLNLTKLKKHREQRQRLKDTSGLQSAIFQTVRSSTEQQINCKGGKKMRESKERTGKSTDEKGPKTSSHQLQNVEDIQSWFQQIIKL